MDDEKMFEEETEELIDLDDLEKLSDDEIKALLDKLNEGEGNE